MPFAPESSRAEQDAPADRSNGIGLPGREAAAVATAAELGCYAGEVFLCNKLR